MPKARKKFNYPPLKEVAYEVIFQPKLKIIEKLADFQDAIAGEYPHIGEEQLVPFPMPAQPLSNNIRQRYVFENLERTRIIRVAIDRFNIVEKNYDSFISFSKELRKLWGVFIKEMGDIKAKRIGLRYINELKIPYSKGNANICKYVKPYYNEKMFKGQNIIGMNIEARVQEHDESMTIRSGILRDETIDSNRYLIYSLDYDCYQQGEKLPGNPTKQLKKYHDLIENRFLSDIEPSYKTYIETGDWL